MPRCDPKPFIPAVLATSSFIVGLLGTTWCEFISITSSSGTEFSFGSWYYTRWEAVETGDGYDVNDSCHMYPNGTDKDPKWRTAMAFSVITPVFGGVTLFWLWLSLCLRPPRALWRKMGLVFLFCSLCQGLTLLFLRSNMCDPETNNVLPPAPVAFEDDCGRVWGANASIAAVVIYFVAGASMFKIPPPPPPEPRPVETQTVTYTKRTQEDGTQVITENAVKGVFVPGKAPSGEAAETANVNV